MLTNLVLRIDEKAQQVFCQKNSKNVVFISVNDGKTRVTRCDDLFDPILRVLGNVDHNHLCPRNHQILCTQAIDAHDTFDHVHAVVCQKLSVVCNMKIIKEFFLSLRCVIMKKSIRQLLKKILLFGFVSLVVRHF